MNIVNKIFKRSIDYEPNSSEIIYFGMGCFWGAEKLFWNMNGILVTAVGYSAGITKNPTYRDVCHGDTFHAEVVKIVYNPNKIDTFHLLKVFWEGHNPTQGMRQGNDFGTQYRSIIITTNNNMETEKMAVGTGRAHPAQSLRRGYVAAARSLQQKPLSAPAH